MDILLERILSLIPRKEDGSFVHGAKKEFAQSIGLKSGNLISDWINGRSESYKGYAFEISKKYNVSVDWLTGKTDEKNPRPVKDEDAEILMKLKRLSPEHRAFVLAAIEGLQSSHE